jgi:hypothetical protein
MKSENDRRRGGNWSREQKEKFIRENFAEAITEDRRGGDRKSVRAKDQNFTEVLIGADSNLAREIEKKSRGKITKGTADRLVAGMRKKGVGPASPVAAAPTLSDTDRKRGEKLALQLKTIRQTRAMLEKKLAATKEEESRLVKELKTIGQPELFGV